MDSETFKRAWHWYGVFCMANAMLNFFACAGCLYVVSRSQELQALWFPASIAEQLPPWYLTMIAGTFGLALCIFGIGNALLMRSPFTKLWWGIHLVNIVVGLGSGVFTLPCLWLLVEWTKAEVKRAFSAPGHDL